MKAILLEEVGWIFKLVAALLVSLFGIGFLTLWVKLVVMLVKAIWSIA